MFLNPLLRAIQVPAWILRDLAKLHEADPVPWSYKTGQSACSPGCERCNAEILAHGLIFDPPADRTDLPGYRPWEPAVLVSARDLFLATRRPAWDEDPRPYWEAQDRIRAATAAAMGTANRATTSE